MIEQQKSTIKIEIERKIKIKKPENQKSKKKRGRTFRGPHLKLVFGREE